MPRNESAGTDESYNVLYGVKAGEAQPKQLASGTRVSGDTPAGAPAATYAVSFVKGDYAVINQNADSWFPTYEDQISDILTYVQEELIAPQTP